MSSLLNLTQIQNSVQSYVAQKAIASASQSLGLPAWLPGWALLLIFGIIFIAVGIWIGKIVMAVFAVIGIFFIVLAMLSAAGTVL